MAVRKALRILWWLLNITFIPLILASPTSTSSSSYDVLIVGGGPAGLATAMALGRVGRSALLIDSAEYRNAATQEMHDVIGFDGTVPAVFRALAREQIRRYPSVKLMNGTIASISVPGVNAESSDFVATSTEGGVYSSRRVVLATGMRDLLPATPGLKDAWGKGVFWCLWCDGWEHKYKPFGNLTPFSASSVNSTISMTQTIFPDSVLLSNGTFTPEAKSKADEALPDWAERLKLFNVTVEDRIIKSFGRVNGNASDYHDDILVTFEDGNSLVRNGIKASFPAELASDLPAKIGLKLNDTDHEIKVQVDKNMETNVTGMQMVGDANSDGSSNVPHALWSAKRAVVYLQGSLGKEFADELVAKQSLHRRGLAIDESFNALKSRLGKRSDDNKRIAQELLEWLEG